MNEQKHVSFYRGHRVTLERDGTRWVADVEGTHVFNAYGYDGAPLQDYEAHALACTAIDEALANA